ncbi:DUF2922 domain-containing protein [Anaerococcus sp. DFU013_CI05]|uniref:DUF2922 domain-containing protein n=1 Tax=Anaerococcus sp. AH8042_DFU013_CI05 TaxID=3385202 RepID=UPI003A522FB2
MANRKLKLYFKDASQNQKSVSIDYPRADYSPSDLKAAMDRMLASTVLVTKYGPVSIKDKAELENVTKRELEIA